MPPSETPKQQVVGPHWKALQQQTITPHNNFQSSNTNALFSSTENTSGYGSMAVIPPEIKGWNWGAFVWGWIWGIGNNTWIALLDLIPYVNLIMPFILGAKGNEWAWQNKRWDNINHFQRAQRSWYNWAIIFAIVIFLMCIIILITYSAAILKQWGGLN